jgi:hypothetical protein
MKNIKRVPLFLLIIVFLAAGNNSMAQEKESRGKTSKEMNKAAAKEVKKEKEFKQMKEEDVDKSQGNAYGKNKGDLKGREFGQARAEQARMHQQARETELDSHLVKGEERVVQSRERIRVAREELEKEKAGRKISEKNYQLKKEKIDNAEKAIDELDEKVRRGRRLSGDR